jgi:hypothetical protein
MPQPTLEHHQISYFKWTDPRTHEREKKTYNPRLRVSLLSMAMTFPVRKI